MRDVFISFTETNEGKVRRIYEDLARSGFSLWEFKSNVVYSENFIQKIDEQIQKSCFFCLIDSNAARRAEYVKMEVSLARKYNKKIIICRIEQSITEPPLFENQEYIVWFSLWDKEYDASIKDLCAFLGKSFIPFLFDAIDKDFIWEMSQLQMKNLEFKTKDWQRLVADYEEFRNEIEQNQQYALDNLLGIISRARHLGITLITPYLVAGNYYARHHFHNEALEIYKAAASCFAQDPRPFAGLGGAHYHLNEYGKSVDAYSTCLALIEKTDIPTHRDRIVLIAHNLLQAMLAGSITNDYIGLINRIAGTQREYWPELDVLKGKYYTFGKQYTAASTAFEKAYTGLKQKYNNPGLHDALYISTLILDLATTLLNLNELKYQEKILKDGIRSITIDWVHLDGPQLRKQLAETYRLLAGNYTIGYEASVGYYEKAIATNRDIKYLAELALMLYNRRPEHFHKTLRQCFDLENNKQIVTNEHAYYMGLAYYLDDRTEIAAFLYKKSTMNWPFYSELL